MAQEDNKKTTKTSKTAKAVKAVVKKKAKKIIGDKGFVYISSTFNNTLITITDSKGNTVANSSPGSIGYKGSKKSTPYAATKAAEDAAQKAIKLGLREVQVVLRGISSGRNAAVKGIRSGGMRISMLSDETPIPHGGPTPKKMPRGS